MLHDLQEPQISASVIRHMQLPIAEYGVDVQGLFRECGINEDELNLTRSSVPLSRYLTFLNKATLTADDPLLSIKLAKSIGVELLGPIGFLFLVSRTLYEGLSCICQYQNLLQESMSLMLTKQRDEYSLSYEIFGLSNFDVRQDIEFSLAYTAQLIRVYTSNRVKPLAVSFRHAPSVSVNRYKQLLGIPCYFNQDNNQLHLNPEDLMLQGDKYDPNLNDILRDYMDSDLDAKLHQFSFTDQVRNTILKLQPDQTISGSYVADQLGLSPSTFYRRLKKEGTNFKAVFNDIQFNLACRYLQGTRLNIYQISQVLGFSSGASFTRAFIKWSGGITPKDYRKTRS